MFAGSDGYESGPQGLPLFGEGGNAVDIGFNNPGAQGSNNDLSFPFMSSSVPPPPLTLGFMMPPHELLASPSKTCEVIHVRVIPPSFLGQQFKKLIYGNWAQIMISKSPMHQVVPQPGPAHVA